MDGIVTVNALNDLLNCIDVIMGVDKISTSCKKEFNIACTRRSSILLVLQTILNPFLQH